VAAAASATDLDARRQEILDGVEALVDNPDGLAESERLQAFIDLYFEYAMLEFPEFATYIGHPGDHDRWSDNSLAAVRRREAEQRRGVEILRTIDREQLEGPDRLNYDLLLHSLEEQIAGQKFLDEYLVLNQMNGVHSSVAQMFAVMPKRNAADYENIVGRLRGAAALVRNDLERMRSGLEQGVTPPKITLRDVPTQLEAVLTEDPMASPVLVPFQQMPDSIA
jgi:uncharacterized protein (DUF885 family)